MSNALNEISKTIHNISSDVLFVRYSNLIFKLIQNFVKTKQSIINRSEIDDIYQEVALKIVKNGYLKKYNKEKSSFITWLNMICRTTAIDYYRSNSRWMDEVDLETEVLVAAEDVELSIFSLPADVLTGRQAEVLTLFFKEGMVADEIAARLNISSPTVRSIKFQALERLRTHYGATRQTGRCSQPEETRRTVS